MDLSLMGYLYLRMWKVLLYLIALRHRRRWTFGICSAVSWL